MITMITDIITIIATCFYIWGLVIINRSLRLKAKLSVLEERRRIEDDDVNYETFKERVRLNIQEEKLKVTDE